YPGWGKTSAAARNSRSRVSEAETPAMRPMPELNERSSHSSRARRRSHEPSWIRSPEWTVDNWVADQGGFPMTVLRSYTGGQWRAPSDEGAPLHDAVTGEELARISSNGIAKSAPLEYGPTLGRPALPTLTLHQRAP